jgi:K+-sensing histidine kinase KdpD
VNAKLRFGLLLAVAVTAPVAVAAALVPLRGHISTTNVALLMIVAVVPVAFGSRVAAIVAAVSAALAFDFFWTPPLFTLNTFSGQDLAGTAVYVAVGVLVGELASQNRRHRAKAEELVSEQAALRRVATLVAKGAPQGKVFAAAAEEVGWLADASTAQIFRYEPDGSIVRLAAWGSGTEDLQIGARYPTGGHGVAATVLHSGSQLASTTPPRDPAGPPPPPGNVISGRWPVTRLSWTAACGAW